MTDGGQVGGVGGVLVLDQLLLSLELPPAHPALVAVPVEPGGRDLTPGHAGLVGSVLSINNYN